MKLETEAGIQRIVEILKKDQAPDGSWQYPFETGLATDAFMIILLRTLEINDEKLIQELAERILAKQEENGAWKLFHDEGDGNLTATLQSYYSLLFSGYYSKDDKRLEAAKQFILANGGIEKSHMFTKVMLALTGRYKWPTFFPLPVEVILLPQSFLINFFDISVVGRVNLAPILILADKKFSLRTKWSPNISDLFTSREDDFFNWERKPEWRSLFTAIEEGVKGLIGLPWQIHSLAINKAKKYMLDRIEPDGTLYSYFSATFLMIFSLLSLGYQKNDPIIIKAVNGLIKMKFRIDGYTHMQYTTAGVWNTSLICFALQKAGVSPLEPVCEQANRYLLDRQQHKYGDWVVHNPGGVPGGWGFSNINTMNPDIDDTTSSLRAMSQLVFTNSQISDQWQKGMKWLISMQNDDGGWPSFEKNINKNLWKLIPIEGAKYLVTDPSTTDLTGRTLEFLGNYTHMTKKNPVIKRGINWLLKNQEKDGSWYGRWGICYLYGTWAAVTGIIASGVSPYHDSIQKAVTWLQNIQNADGGWGESCKSDIMNYYVPLGTSTLSQTAWALDALIAAAIQPTPAIQAGVKFLLEGFERHDWTFSYPTGQGMAGGFYVNYHSYNYVFPLLALANYKRKFLE
ncbi:squalene--hopene cyclase [Bacillus sp. FJAT-29790]|uniref:squalene--hopene cyclase n=1 Tax=Bacillus sp. FJAT-29790 TaxID=1895002 RepID=UPI001C248BF0|nr:squalene--hopene cyclase [Bacillus sp. FJAT-29790]